METTTPYILHPEHLDAVHAAAKNILRPALSSLYVTHDRVVSTDAYRLVEVTRLPDNATPIMLGAKSLHVTRKAMRKDTTFVALEPLDGETVKASIVSISKNSEVKVLAERITGANFPPYESVFPKTPPLAYIKLSASYLRDLAAYIEKHSGEHAAGVVLELYGDKIPAVFRCTTKNAHKMRALIMPLRMTDEEKAARTEPVQLAPDKQEPQEGKTPETADLTANLPF